MPRCDFCSAKAEYDFKTGMGPWAYGCKDHYWENRHFPNLGTGMGQKLVLDRG